MKHLFCMFNANDPTPTAAAIRSSSYDKVTVIILGREWFNQRQEGSLYRFKKWLSGTVKSAEAWPKGLWKEEWDWNKTEAEVEFVKVDDLSEITFDIHPDSTVIVDLKSGTKKMSIEMMEYAQQQMENVQFIMSNLGSCIALTFGVVVPTPHLSLNEMVWLSSGSIIDVDYDPDDEFVSNAVTYFDYSWNRRFLFKQHYLEKMGKVFNGSEEHDKKIHHNYLEEFTTAALKKKDEIVQVFGGVRFIHPDSLDTCLEKAMWAARRDESEFAKEHRQNIMEFLSGVDCDDDEIIDYVREKIHTMEIDCLALTRDGLMIGVECKYGVYGEKDLNRLNAICSSLSPRFYPLMVNTRLEKEHKLGVHQIPFPVLLDPLDTILSPQ